MMLLGGPPRSSLNEGGPATETRRPTLTKTSNSDGRIHAPADIQQLAGPKKGTRTNRLNTEFLGPYWPIT